MGELAAAPGPASHGSWRWRELLGLVLLGFAMLALWQVPMLGWLVYPFRLFGTFVHELSHGMAAVATGGDFVRFSVHADLSGLAWSAGGSRWIVASAGYVGSAAFGGLLLLLAARGVSGRILLTVLGAALLVLSLLYVRNVFGIASGLGLSALLILAGARLRAAWADALLWVLALQALLDGFNSLFVVWNLSGDSSVQTDAHTMATLTGLPAGLWVGAWVALSLLVLLMIVRLAYRRGAR
ncbi:MAG TPA: M50 family metallopeptidase [Arenimonas sp.]|nr:M50 family metallopeptidase [Arenimonas sp.]